MKSKSIKALLLSVIISMSVSCKDAQNEVDATDAAQESEATQQAASYQVDTKASKIAWVGSKVTGSHTGNLSLRSGMISVDGDQLESGSFVIDMQSIEVTDLQGDDAAKLKAHLSGTVDGTETDFFNVNKFPTAQFKVTGVNVVDGKTMLSGNLTIKGIKKNISFGVNVSYKDNQMLLTSDAFTINRTDWGIKYGSQSFSDKVLDNAISDDIELTIHIVGVKK